MTIAAWKASWIWDGETESPRNAWQCFRKSFDVPGLEQLTDKEEALTQQEAILHLTADSRYVLAVNGVRVGKGPVRSWTFEQSYDSYEIGHLLKAGQTNTIAVLVLHFGVSTFSYTRGRGGLLAQLDLKEPEGETHLVITDNTWKTAKHLGHHPRAPRMSCQLAFSEYVDASKWDDSWMESNYDDSDWSQAAIIGEVGMEPWTTLKERDIPYLTEEIVYPSRVESLSAVQSFTYSAAIDMRNHMVAGSDDHMNRVGFTGYLATVIRAEEECSAILGFTFAGDCVGDCTLNGERIDRNSFTGILPERYLEVQLKRGDHLFVMDITGRIHTGIFHIGVYSDHQVELVSPLNPAAPTPFLTMGPFDSAVYLDHQRTRDINSEDPIFKEVLNRVRSIADLSDYPEQIREIPAELVSEVDVSALSIWQKEKIGYNIPASLHNMVIPNPASAVVPVFPGYDTELIIDFGRELTGYLTFEIEAEEGVILDFYGFEYMSEHGRDQVYGLDNTLRYVCKKGRQSYQSPIRRGLRYQMVTVRNASRPVAVYEIKYVLSHYPVAEIGKFQCSDPLLNDIWEISRHTTKLCMEDTFVDCPAYEQVFWVGDSRNEALVSNYLFGVSDIVKRCLELVPGSKFQTPFYANQVPSGWSSVIPNWTFFWAIACQEYYEQTGDHVFVEEMYPHIRYTLENYVTKLDDKQLFNFLGWNLLDWSPIDQPNNGIVTHQNCFLVKTLRTASELAILAGDEDGRHKFTETAEVLAAAINQHLWSEESNAYIDCIHADGRRSDIISMQTQVVAYLTGVAQNERKQLLEGYLLHSPSHFVQIGSPFMSFFYYEALSVMGKPRTIVEDIRRNYGQMIDHGATTCWEMYPNFKEGRTKKDVLTRSHCHAWSAGPAYFLGTEVLGIRKAATGWQRVTIAPQPVGVAWAKGSVPLPDQGRIDVSWSFNEIDRQLNMSVKHPDSIQVDILIPDGYTGHIQVVKLQGIGG